MRQRLSREQVLALQDRALAYVHLSKFDVEGCELIFCDEGPMSIHVQRNPAGRITLIGPVNHNWPPANEFSIKEDGRIVVSITSEAGLCHYYMDLFPPKPGEVSREERPFRFLAQPDKFLPGDAWEGPPEGFDPPPMPPEVSLQLRAGAVAFVLLALEEVRKNVLVNGVPLTPELLLSFAHVFGAMSVLPPGELERAMATPLGEYLVGDYPKKGVL
jgi:hypothetical protein